MGWRRSRKGNSGRRGGSMKRRDFLRSAGVASAAMAFPKAGRMFVQGTAPEAWRTFDVTTSVEVLKPSGATRIWIPAALVSPTPFQKTLANNFKAEGGTAKLIESRADSLGFIAAEFPPGVMPVLKVTSRVTTTNFAVDLSVPGRAPKEDQAELKHFQRATKLMPTDGIVRATATDITKDSNTDVEKARAIYDWIVENTSRNPKTRGCGLGDIRFRLETKDLGRKCADLDALHVGLARAAGLPPRDVYGIRIAKSEIGYRCVGPPGQNVTKSQHCRAEVYLS